MNFDSFSFHPRIKAGIVAAGYFTPTSIQLRTIPPIIAGRDVLGLAQTGTGKTAAFVLPILQRLLQGPRGKLRALIVSPTRELAEQTHTAISSLGRQTGLRSLTLYGGVNARPQIMGLRAGADIAVACPGRLLDLMEQKVVSLNSIEVLVLDEADQMFDMGFLPAIRRIIAAVPKERQTLLFSATMPPEILTLANNFLKNPETVEIGTSHPIETVSHAIYPVDQERKAEMLLEILHQTGSGQILIFTRTKHRCSKLAEQLKRAGLSATALQGNLSQVQRQNALEGFRSGRVRVLVATDIAARGIDISQISHVINFDIPNTAEAYTHRIGRTGRMEHFGTAFTLVTQEDLPMIRTIERLLGSPLERRKLPGFEPQALHTDRPTPVKSTPSAYQSQPSRRPVSSDRPRTLSYSRSTR